MDPYVYHKTNVLKNLRDIRDLHRLAQFGMDMTTRRLAELEHEPMPGRFATKYLQAIHRYIFQDVFAWAGELRTVNIARPGQFYFAYTEQIAPSFERTFAALREEAVLKVPG